MKFFGGLRKRNGLGALRALDARRLSDLGLCHQDILDAGKMGASADLLNSRRDERAGFWLR